MAGLCSGPLAAPAGELDDAAKEELAAALQAQGGRWCATIASAGE